MLVVASLSSFLLELAADTALVGNSGVRFVCRDKMEIPCATHRAARDLTALPLGRILASWTWLFALR